MHCSAHDVVCVLTRKALLLADEQVCRGAFLLVEIIVPDHVALVVEDDELIFESEDSDPICVDIGRSNGVGECSREEAAVMLGQHRLLVRLAKTPWQSV